jgi:casein kinase II subunit alpha
VASRYFKGPELMTNNMRYHYSLDIWSLGAMFAGMIFKHEPFFKGKDNNDQLIKVMQVMGSKSVIEYISKYNLKPDKEVTELFKDFKKKELGSFVDKMN